LNLQKTAVLVIDLQNEYRPGAAWAVTGYDRILSLTAEMMAAARTAGVPVIHAQASVAPEQRDTYKLQEEMLAEEHRSAIAGSHGAAICDEVAPQPGDIVHVKTWASAFRHTDLKERLLAMGIENLIVAGVLTDSCVTATTFDAVYEGFHVWLVKDCCGSMTELMHRSGFLDMVNRLYGGGVLRQAEAIKALAGQPYDVWRCTRPIEFPFTAETIDAIYDSL